MRFWFSLLVVLILLALATVGAEVGWLRAVFAVGVPALAAVVFLVGFVLRVVRWARTPVPFKITTTCGQQKALPWIRHDRFEAPTGAWGVIGRMAMEVLLFRSLFRNTKAELRQGPKLAYGTSVWLWFGAMAFHWSMLVIVIRHFRFFTEPMPGFVAAIESVDGFFQVGLPVIYITDILFPAALLYLLYRRLADAKVSLLSLTGDYFPLLLLLAIGTTGVLMRYFTKVDLIEVKHLVMGLLSGHPVVPEGVGVLFYLHLFLVSTLLVYFPFSKLMHMPGIFLSPTRNMANDNRTRRHVNPWNYPVKVHTYEEYEDEFRDVMKAAGLPVEKE
ncbi:MAG TPA: menaquinol oxidoreductase [Bacteroidetes bacterium]|nr:menaquinol oxidoreductase [Bacteroidota bacterium]